MWLRGNKNKGGYAFILRQTAQIDSASTTLTFSFPNLPLPDEVMVEVVDLSIPIVPFISASIQGRLLYLNLRGGTYSAINNVFGSLGATMSTAFRILGIVGSA